MIQTITMVAFMSQLIEGNYELEEACYTQTQPCPLPALRRVMALVLVLQCQGHMTNECDGTGIGPAVPGAHNRRV